MDAVAEQQQGQCTFTLSGTNILLLSDAAAWSNEHIRISIQNGLMSIREKYCWKGCWFPWQNLVLTPSNYEFHYQFTSDLWQVMCTIFPFIHLFVPVLCWQKCLYTFDMYTQGFIIWFPMLFFFLFHSHLIIWRWIWVVGNLGTCSHIFHITSLILIISK